MTYVDCIQVERGIANKGTEIEIIGWGETKKTTITGIGASVHAAIRASAHFYPETFHKELDRAEAGDNTGLLLRGMKRDEIRRGQVIALPGSIKQVAKFEAQVYVCHGRFRGDHFY